MRSSLSYCFKPGLVRASAFAGGWKRGLEYARLSARVLCFWLFERGKVGFERLFFTISKLGSYLGADLYAVADL